MNHVTPLNLAAAFVALTASSTAAAQTPTHAISSDAPWARALDDELSKPLLDQMYGKDAADALRASGPRQRGVLTFNGESFDEELLDAHNLPLPAQGYEASPGVLYVAFDGVTLQPTCPTSEIANAALNCSPLVSAETTFPAWGSGNERAGVIQTLQSYYEDFNLTITTNRPPDWLPYTMAVVGGSAGQAGFDGACGVANVQCDGLKRNHVSLNFPQSCGAGAMPDTIAQETSHNWGLEHTDNTTDLMYPQVTGGNKRFVDNCMDVIDGNGASVNSTCGYVHELHCAAGGNDQQNSYAELMGVFGPRVVDSSAPVLLGVTPANGSQFTTADSIAVSANIDDDSTFIGVKWTWLEGVPEGVDEYTRCTNNVCTDGYNTGPAFEPADMPWDFVVLDQPPVGTYSFQIEAFDSYANYLSQTITFQVVEPGAADGGSADGGSADGSGDGSSADAGVDGDGTAASDGTAGDGGTGAGADGGDGGGGGCRTVPTPAPAWSWLGLLPALLLRRRR